ncbi:MAG: sensor histidine kinase, partial [Chitinophagaceae bacterium]
SPRIEISSKVLESQINISITDNGPGIPDKIKDTLFDAFVTANKSNGTGLGLAIVKQFVKAIGGTITVANNNGAVFKLTLPRA